MAKQSAIVEWANDPRVLQYLKSHPASDIVENGDYIRPQQDWGKSFDELHPNGKHSLDAGLGLGMKPLPSGKLLTHPTISNESPFSEGKGGTWTQMSNGSYTYTPSQWQQQNQDMRGLGMYFKIHEKGNKLNLGKKGL